MKFRDHSQTKRAEMQLAPMIDVVFLLLIFFIVSWNFARFEVAEGIDVPEAATAETRPRNPGEIIINVDGEGKILISSEEMDEAGLIDRLSQLAQNYPDQPVILRGHNEVEFTAVMEVLDACQKAGIWNVAFAAMKMNEEVVEGAAP